MADPQVVQELSESLRWRIAREQLATGLTRLLGPLQQPMIRFVESSVEWVRLQAGETLFAEGDRGQYASEKRKELRTNAALAPVFSR